MIVFTIIGFTADISRGDWTRGAKLPKRTAKPVGSPPCASQPEQTRTMTIPNRAAVQVWYR
jgi:hypothetical protein